MIQAFRASRVVPIPALRIEELANGLIDPVSFECRWGMCRTDGRIGGGQIAPASGDCRSRSAGNARVGDHVRSDMPASEWRKLVALVPAESGWWADRVGDHFFRSLTR
jgi:hypothetical protein